MSIPLAADDMCTTNQDRYFRKIDRLRRGELQNENIILERTYRVRDKDYVTLEELKQRK